MADVENVIYAIERCTCHVPDACRDCPYDAGHPYNECIEMLLKDAMELLKEQNKIIKSLTDEKERLLSERIAELQHNIDALHAIMQDTILVNNAIEQRKGG